MANILDRFSYKSVATAVATPLTVQIPTNVELLTVVVETDVAGTGTIAVTGSVAGSGNVPFSTPVSIDISSLDIVHIEDGSYSALVFTPSGIATATTYTVYIQGKRN